MPVASFFALTGLAVDEQVEEAQDDNGGGQGAGRGNQGDPERRTPVVVFALLHPCVLGLAAILSCGLFFFWS